ncbi:death-associated protein 1 isoform X1 [Bubalus kerabau]|uniref:death-associated protein 1 isoform X1 n=1 Tax=Bubalus carabanensis TaxID=3119969 RepID=UPI001D0FD7C9|nr:death-associated protein 1 isoform X1 [Bubalus carabanensis]
MSSPPEGKLETKAGHPPAVKAGGMRIVQKHPHSGDTKEEKDKDDQEWESPSPGDKTLSKCISRIYLYAQPGMQLELPLISVPECVRADGSSAPEISYSNAFMKYV